MGCIGNRETLETLRDSGVHYAAIEGRGFYVSLNSGGIYNKADNKPRVDNPLTVGLAMDRVWQEFSKQDAKKTAPAPKQVEKLYGLFNEDGLIAAFETRGDAEYEQEAISEQDDEGNYDVEIRVFIPRD